MLAELMTETASRLIGNYPPDGSAYWAERFWDRATLENLPVFGDQLKAAKEDIVGLLERHAGGPSTMLEFGCGTGEFTLLAAKLTDVEEIVALDISPQALEIAQQRVPHSSLKLVCGDFWADHSLSDADLVMCADAIHHLGDVRQVLRRLKSFVGPGGVFIGNLWTNDHFHEEQRYKHGPVRHARNCAKFLGSALLLRLSAGRIRTHAYRSQLLSANQIEPLLKEEFGEVMEVIRSRYFVSFACRP